MPSRVMNQEDYAAIRLMVDQGILEPLSVEKLPKNGFVKVVCPDGDNAPEMLRYFHFHMCMQANGEAVCTHLAPIAGGPAAIPKQSPMHQFTYKGVSIAEADLVVFSYIEGALAIKGIDRIRNIALVPHAPCGMANRTNLSVWDNFHLTFLAKDRIRKEFPGVFDSVKVTPHINYADYPEATSNKPCRTYLLRRRPFMVAYAKHIAERA